MLMVTSGVPATTDSEHISASAHHYAMRGRVGAAESARKMRRRHTIGCTVTVGCAFSAPELISCVLATTSSRLIAVATFPATIIRQLGAIVSALMTITGQPGATAGTELSA